jgi:hypothetical protein
MADPIPVNADHQTQKITIQKKTVKITHERDDLEYPKAVKKEGKFILPWKTEKTTPDGWNNFKYFLTPDSSRVPNEQVSALSIGLIRYIIDSYL